VTTEVTTLKLRVVPGATRNEVVGWHGDAIRIRCQAPALEGRANTAVTGFLAAQLGLRRTAVRLVQGARSRDKVVTVAGLSRADAYARLGLARIPE
jgi:uncharacterized protein